MNYDKNGKSTTDQNEIMEIEVDYYKPEALKSLYRSPGYRKNQLVLCKNYVLQWQSSWNYDQHKKTQNL